MLLATAFDVAWSGQARSTTDLPSVENDQAKGQGSVGEKNTIFVVTICTKLKVTPVACERDLPSLLLPLIVIACSWCLRCDCQIIPPGTTQLGSPSEQIQERTPARRQTFTCDWGMS